MKAKKQNSSFFMFENIFKISTFFCLFFIVGISFFSKANDRHNNLTDNFSPQLTESSDAQEFVSNNQLNLNSSSLEIPLSSEESESPTNESKEEDNKEEDNSKSKENNHPSIIFSAIDFAAKSYFNQFCFHILNRTTTPLFLVHQSWKILD